MNRWRNLADEADRKRTDQSFMVPVDDIRVNAYDLRGRAIWQRDAFSEPLKIVLPEPGHHEEQTIHTEAISKNKAFKLVLFIQTYRQGKNQYVKLLLANWSSPHLATSF